MRLPKREIKPHVNTVGDICNRRCISFRMVDYTKFYFRNYTGVSKGKGGATVHRRARRSFGVRIGMALIVASFLITLASLNSLTGGLLRDVLTAKDGTTRCYYAVVTSGFENTESAGNHAVSDRNAGGAGKVAVIGEELSVVSGIYDLRTIAELTQDVEQDVVAIEVSLENEAFIDALDSAFSSLTALIQIIECGADRALVEQAVNTCSYELVKKLGMVDALAEEQSAVHTMLDCIERLKSSPCASNARMVLVESVLSLGAA